MPGSFWAETWDILLSFTHRHLLNTYCCVAFRCWVPLAATTRVGKTDTNAIMLFPTCPRVSVALLVGSSTANLWTSHHVTYSHVTDEGTGLGKHRKGQAPRHPVCEWRTWDFKTGCEEPSDVIWLTAGLRATRCASDSWVHIFFSFCICLTFS